MDNSIPFFEVSTPPTKAHLCHLAVTKHERDLGVMVDRWMKMSTQCVATVKKANSMLSIIRKGIENKTVRIILPVEKSMVRPHLEYCIQFWSPHLKKDII